MNKMKVFAFVGPSGTGKSHRAHLVAAKYKVDYIIDDGLLISNNKVIEGKSAKTEATKIASVKNAIFIDEERRKTMAKKIKSLKIESILILGTSDGMVDKIAENLGLPKISHYIRIEEFATEEEMKLARKTRLEQGKHVVPVPTFEVKEQFSGYFIDPLKIFSKKKENPTVTEKTIIRPTFSYLGKYTIGDSVIRDIIQYVGIEIDGVYKVSRVRIEKYVDGINLDVDVIIDYGKFIPGVVKQLESKIRTEIDLLTGINIFQIKISVKGINVESN